MGESPEALLRYRIIQVIIGYLESRIHSRWQVSMNHQKLNFVEIIGGGDFDINGIG
jgi:hypothetical protein